MRRIVTSSLQSTDGGHGPADGFFDRILKYIPADIVAGWVALDGLIRTSGAAVLWGVFGVMAAFAFLWTMKQTSVPGKPKAMQQSVLAAVSFAVWVFALHSGPFAAMTYSESLGSAALIIYTLGVGLVVPSE